MTEIFVCQAGSCRRGGSEAVLLEIEELANAVDEDCRVKPSGCLGLCSKAPAALVVRKNDNRGRRRRRNQIRDEVDGARDSEEYFTRIANMEESTEVVYAATGKRPPSIEDSPQLWSRLSGARALRVRENAVLTYRWNDAIKAVLEQMSTTDDFGNVPKDLLEIYLELVAKAGFSGTGLPRYLSREEPAPMPSKIEKYSLWSLESVSPISRHSAVFRFLSRDVKRGTPHPRGRNRGLPTPITWHTTLLAKTGFCDEGPLPWIERDYTPISSAKEWEKGTCDILIKIYNDGKATSWLHRIWRHHRQASQKLQELGDRKPNHKPADSLQLWFSQPVKTLYVPGLNSTRSTNFRPESVLLLLAGTGVVALPQILHHRDPYKNLGISTKRSSQLRVPIDLVLSYRSDDVLMLPKVTEYCQQAHDFASSNPQLPVVKGVRRCTLLLTGKNGTGATPDEDCPFEGVELRQADDQLTRLGTLPNARVVHSRLTPDLVSDGIRRMPVPCRIVVSGPSGFNSAARTMLLEAEVDEEAITILEA